MLCFFRQKTDYDLRISDWSSDVCSSDLNDCGCHTGGHEGWTQAWRAPLRHALDVLRDWGIEVMARRGPDLLHDPWLARDAYVSVDRKSVVLGQRVSVRVCPCGLRIITKKRQHTLLSE